MFIEKCSPATLSVPALKKGATQNNELQVKPPGCDNDRPQIAAQRDLSIWLRSTDLTDKSKYLQPGNAFAQHYDLRRVI